MMLDVVTAAHICHSTPPFFQPPTSNSPILPPFIHSLPPPPLHLFFPLRHAQIHSSSPSDLSLPHALPLLTHLLQILLLFLPFRERFSKELEQAIHGTVRASPDEWGETLEGEQLRGGSFLEQDQIQVRICIEKAESFFVL